MSRFYTGDVTGDEFKMVLMAAEHDPDLMEEIEIMTSISDQLANIRIKRKAAPTPTIDPTRAEYLPIYKLAAESKKYGSDMIAPNDCVVRCEQFVLQQFNVNAPLETLIDQSKNNGWLKDGGTPLHHIGRLLSEHQLSVVRRYDCNLDIISHELNDGCQVIAAINTDKLYNNDSEKSTPNHAVVVLSVNEQEVRIFDPLSGQKASYATDSFISAWKDSHYYIISVTKRGAREYNPQPIDANNFQLPNDLKELMEAIAENGHEVWAKQRKEEGWKYGPERDDKNKKHPDLIPYSDLTESEKEYDRKMAKETLMLVQRLGYKIIKEE